MLVLLGPFTKSNEFPTLSYTSTSKMPILSYTWGLKEVPVLGRASPYRPCISYYLFVSEEWLKKKCKWKVCWRSGLDTFAVAVSVHVVLAILSLCRIPLAQILQQIYQLCPWEIFFPPPCYWTRCFWEVRCSLGYHSIPLNRPTA